MTDFKNILDKAKEFEKKIKDSQNIISQITAEGVSGGDKVKITLTTHDVAGLSEKDIILGQFIDNQYEK